MPLKPLLFIKMTASPPKKPFLFSWQARILPPDGDAFKALFMAHTMEQAWLAAQELYPDSVIRIVGVEPDWDDELPF